MVCVCSYKPRGYLVPMPSRRIALLLSPIAVSGCTLGSTSCTAVGYESTVRIVGAGSGQIAEFCVDDVCLPGSGDLVGIAVPVSDEPAEYEYRLTFASGTGPASTIRGTVETEEYRVNGPRCDPITANATLTVNDNGDVEVSHP